MTPGLILHSQGSDVLSWIQLAIEASTSIITYLGWRGWMNNLVSWLVVQQNWCVNCDSSLSLQVHKYPQVVLNCSRTSRYLIWNTFNCLWTYWKLFKRFRPHRLLQEPSSRRILKGNPETRKLHERKPRKWNSKRLTKYTSLAKYKPQKLRLLPYNWNEKEYKYQIIESATPSGEMDELDEYIFVLRIRIGEYINLWITLCY